jgi:hypothetical protein
MEEEENLPSSSINDEEQAKEAWIDHTRNL